MAVSIQRDTDGIMDWMAAARGTASVIEDSAVVNDAASEVYTKYLGSDRRRFEVTPKPSDD